VRKGKATHLAIDSFDAISTEKQRTFWAAAPLSASPFAPGDRYAWRGSCRLCLPWPRPGQVCALQGDGAATSASRRQLIPSEHIGSNGALAAADSKEVGLFTRWGSNMVASQMNEVTHYPSQFGSARRGACCTDGNYSVLHRAATRRLFQPRSVGTPEGLGRLSAALHQHEARGASSDVPLLVLKPPPRCPGRSRQLAVWRGPTRRALQGMMLPQK